MVVLLKWNAPDEGFRWTSTRIYRASSQAGSYTELTSSDVNGYVTNVGVPIVTTEVKDKVGTSASWYKMAFYDGSNLGEYSDPIQGDSIRGYCTVEDVRNFTNVQKTEYSDGQLQMLIDTTTAEINSFTGRTWQGVETVTNEYYDGDGSGTLYLDHPDVQAISAIGIDELGDLTTYTALSATDYFLYGGRGKIVLNRKSSITAFPDAERSVRVSYTHGNSEPTDEVKNLTLLIITQLLKRNQEEDYARNRMVLDIKNRLRARSYRGV